MAQKTRTTLQNDSDSIFLDNTSGQIIPANHRDFNDDIIDSCANLEDNNVFDGDNQFTGMLQADGATTINGTADFNAAATFNDTATFNGESTFNDKVTHAAQVVSGYAGATIASADTIDLTNVDGNLIFITGTTEINTILGNIGAIFYCTFVNGTDIVPIGTSIQPQKSLRYNAGDTIIFVIQAANQIRILGRYRDGGSFSEQSAFTIDYYDFTPLVANSLLQVGAVYDVGGVPNLTNFLGIPAFNLRVTAASANTLIKRAILYLPDYFIPVWIGSSDIADIKIYGPESSELNTFNIDQFNTDNQNSPLYYPGSQVVLADGIQNFRALVTQYYDAQRINLIEYTQKGLAGIYIQDSLGNRFWYRNDAPHNQLNDTRWGNNPDFEFIGVTPMNLDLLNADYNNPISVSDVRANYQLVNQLCTITIDCIFESAFNSNPFHSALLYFPLPFRVTNAIDRGNGIGHGSLEFVNIPNHPNIGVHGNYLSDPYSCLFFGKWSSTINTSEMVRISASYTYHIEA
jgi:hypothetical protein